MTTDPSSIGQKRALGNLGALLAATVALVYGCLLLVMGFVPSSISIYHALSTVGLIAGLICWTLAIFLWSKKSGNNLLRVMVLVLLVLFGFLWGWLYVLASLRHNDASLR